MGLSLTLTKDNNYIYTTFNNAYWVVEDIYYEGVTCHFTLKCFPTREAKMHHAKTIQVFTLPIGGSAYPTYSSILYQWNGEALLEQLFPNGIPLDQNIQKTIIYNFVKQYTGLPFQDVFEEGQNENQ